MNIILEKSKTAGIFLSWTGYMAWLLWYEIPHHYTFVVLDGFVVMPNHVHGLLIFDKSNSISVAEDTDNSIGLKKNSLSLLVNQYKGALKRRRNEQKMDFQWQSKFCDHVIRNNRSLENIRQYIQNNPGKWSGDRNRASYG